MAKRSAQRNAPERDFAELYREVRTHLAKAPEPKEEDLRRALEAAKLALADKEAELARISQNFHEADYDLVCARRDLDEARAAIAAQALQISELIGWKRDCQRANELRRFGASVARGGNASSAAASVSSVSEQ